MPYATTSELPKTYKKYSQIVQRQLVHVFNSTYKKVYSETKSKTDAERRAMMAMNSVLKKRLIKNSERNSQDYMNHMVDRWLGNLRG